MLKIIKMDENTAFDTWGPFSTHDTLLYSYSCHSVTTCKPPNSENGCGFNNMYYALCFWKALLEADGHTDVQPSHFFPNDQSSSSSTSLLLIILRNEDIAEHIVKVVKLLVHDTWSSLGYLGNLMLIDETIMLFIYSFVGPPFA